MNPISKMPSNFPQHILPCLHSSFLAPTLFMLLVFFMLIAELHAQPVSSLGPAEMPLTLAPSPRIPRPALREGDAVPIGLGDVGTLEYESKMGQESVPGPLRIGFDRPIPELQDPGKFWSRQAWYLTLDGGLSFAFRITSPGAMALRLGLRVSGIPDEAILKFYPLGAAQVEEMTGAIIKARLQRNFDAGEMDEDAETLWSGVIEGDTATIEIELPISADPAELEVALPRLSHLFQSPLGSTEIEDRTALPCELDVMCSPAWDVQSRATARMVYTKDQSTYLCTGTLLNDADSSTYIPYFYSANHCISTQTAATSLQTFWFWRASACNSGTPGTYQTLTGGADLLYASPATDTSFLRLLGTPPSGVIFSGWSASLPANLTALTGVHHPGGDLQKISFGSLSNYWHCLDGEDGIFYCNSTQANSSDHFSISWQNGITEGGSSGSGIFLNDTLQFVGSLHGGTSSCSNPAGPDYYGRFDIPYLAALHNWLNYWNFYDVSPDSWAAKYINTIYKAGITSGCGNGNYCPGGLVTREEMAAFLVRADVGEPPVNYCAGVPPFNDVSPNAWSCGYIKRLNELKITGGCGNGNYCPSGLVTREQMAVFLVRAKEGEPPVNYCGGIPPFNDVSPNAWSCGYIKRLNELKVTSGCGNGNYCPAGLVSREEMAAFLARAFLGME